MMYFFKTWYFHIVGFFGDKRIESLVLFLVRLTLAGVFWRSGRTKIVEGSWISVSDDAIFQFGEDPFNRVPLLSPEVAAHAATYAEHALPALLVLGLFARLSALGLFGMTMVIQIFVFPDAWWQVHSLWAALCLVIVTRGAGLLSVDSRWERAGA